MKLQIATLALFAAAVSTPALAAPATFRGLQEDDCAIEGDRAQECPGVTNTGRPSVCCEGLVCSGSKCVQPDACAAEGEKAIECGIAQVNRPAECCDGLACNEEKKCTADGEGVPEPDDDTTPEPTPMVSEDPEDSGEPTPTPPKPENLPTDCGLDGERTVECGADAKNGRPEECCPGLTCNLNQRRCVAGPPTVAPTVAPTGMTTAEKMVGTSYCTWSPDFDCFDAGWPACCAAGDCPAEQPACEKMVGTSYCTFAPDYDCYKTGWPACCVVGTVDCPDEQPACETTPEPTMMETPEPTAGGDEPAPTSGAAGVFVTGFATVAVAAPLLLL